jgi:hypothetical protein
MPCPLSRLARDLAETVPSWLVRPSDTNAPEMGGTQGRKACIAQAEGGPGVGFNPLTQAGAPEAVG